MGRSIYFHSFTLNLYLVQTMNEMGAKMIGFVGVPPLGCCPSQRTGLSRECEPLRNQASELFNTRMKQEIDRLNAEHNIDDLRVAYIDIYYNLLDLIHNPGYYGTFVNSL